MVYVWELPCATDVAPTGEMAPYVPADAVILKVVTPQAGVEQLRVAEPEQVAPPFAGAGFVQVRVSVPVCPQAVTEHEPYALQPPFTGVGVGVTTVVAPPPPPPPPE